MKNIAKLFEYIKDERRRLIITALISAALGVVGIVTPLFFRFVINRLTEATGHPAAPHVVQTIALAIAGLAVLQIISSIFEFFRERLSDRLYLDVLVKLQQRIFSHMMNLSIDYYEREKVGEIVTKATFAIYEFTSWIESMTQNWLTSTLQLIFASTLLWILNPRIGGIVSFLIVLGVGIQVVRIRRSRAIRREARIEYEKAGGHMNETIAHITTIRSSVDAGVPVAKYEELLSRGKALNWRQNNIEQYGNLARSLVNDLAVLAGVGLISWQSLKGGATPGDVVAVALYLQQVTSSIGPLGRLIVNTSQVESSVERIIELLEEKPTVVDAPDASELKELKTIEFKNVSFCYPGKKRKVLKNISFKLDAGQTLALVGPSGTGKTTITKLLLRFYEPSDGEILLNGQPIQQYTGESIRRHIGMVMQDVALFNDTIEANLQLARPDAPREDVEEAARLAHADVFIQKLPEKYATMVGERGVKLSGGEKQRVAIARAALKSPDLIVLDEATSALDSESERHVQAGLRQLMNDRTAIVIAHRLSTVMRADNILVLKNGEIVERGRHEDLAEIKDGLYAKLFKLQTEGFLQG